MILNGHNKKRYSFGLGAEVTSGLPASRSMQRERPQATAMPWGTIVLIAVAGLFLLAPTKRR